MNAPSLRRKRIRSQIFMYSFEARKTRGNRSQRIAPQCAAGGAFWRKIKAGAL
jgi:hypothetical protein